MKKKRKMKLNISNILLLIFIIVFIYSTFNIISIFVSKNRNNKEVEIIQNQVIINKEVVKRETEDFAEEEEELSLDFNKLNKINSDTVGWIEIRNTSINYPIVQANNNEYYLKHSFYKRHNENGWIFLNSLNNSDFNDLNTVIFGHDTRSRNMFSDLTKLYDGLLGNYIPITIYTENETYHYVTFALFLTDENDQQFLKNYLTAKDIEDAKSKSKFKFDMIAIPSDNILTLSTCYHSPKQKVTLLAVRV